jgi:hypothetical protein
VAIFDFLKEENLMNTEMFKGFYQKAEELSKMLFAMIKNLETLKKAVN